MPRQSKKLKVGDRAPGFRLEDVASGRQVALEDLLGEPLMIVFLRGTW